MQRIDFRAMGCQMLALMDAPDLRFADTLRPVPHWFAEWEQSLSRFRADSELNRLNANAGNPFQVSETLGRVIEQALIAARVSEGLVTPAVCDAVERAGYDRSFELLEPREARQVDSVAVTDWRAMQYDATTRMVRMPSSMRLDLGGVAKGWAADETARRLARNAPTLVDAGGDIALSGPRANGDAWQIAIADPFHPDDDLEIMAVDAGGIATSGRDYRAWKIGERTLHHIIDPRTGEPAETDIISVTIVAPNTMLAEIAAKVVFILGSRQGIRWLDARSHLAGLLVLDNRRVISSARFGEYVWRESVTNAPRFVLEK